MPCKSASSNTCSVVQCQMEEGDKKVRLASQLVLPQSDRQFYQNIAGGVPKHMRQARFP